VDGSKIFIDSRLVDANASNNSVVVDKQSLKVHLRGVYEKLEGRLAESRESTDRLEGLLLEEEQSVYLYDGPGCSDRESWEAKAFLSGSSGGGWEGGGDYGHGDDRGGCQ